jgi:hypothetical protein
MLMIPAEYDGYIAGKINGHFSPSFPCFATKRICWYLPEGSGGRIWND